MQGPDSYLEAPLVINLNIVIDASILAKWFLPGEEDAEIALRIKDDFAQGNVSISLPSLIYYEINNLLKSAVISMRIDPKKAVKIYGDFLDLDFEIYATKELLKSTLDYAVKYNISSYDASYVALAEYLQKPFFTADKNLLDKVKNKFVFGLEKYPLSV